MSEQDAVEIETASGRVSGLRAEDHVRFLGIPYAAAPVGELRFAAPRPPAPWTGVRAAHAFGPTAPKPPLGGRLGEIVSDPDVEGPDCLNLNVWTPDPAESGLPVLVWIHGGGFTTGSSAVPSYDGATFARDGVVCVSLNYRLGVYGFGYLPDAPAPANRGLLDQIAALRWVQDNIAAFGGDPGRVTVAGESAGAMSILALMSRDDGLFHRAIVQSGTAHLGQTPQDAAKVLKHVADELKVEPTARALGGVDTDALLAAQNLVSGNISVSPNKAKYGESTMAACGLAFMPVVDGDVLPRRPIDALADGAGSTVELLMGTTTEEFRLFVLTQPLLVNLDSKIMYNAHLAAYSVPSGTWDEYAKGGSATYPRAKAYDVACAVFTERMFRIPTYRIAEARARVDAAPTHLYEFGWRSRVAPNDRQVGVGACHSLDLPFAWDTLDLADSQKFTGPNPPQALADTLHRAWADFAQGADVPWAAYDTDNRPVMAYAHDNDDTAHHVVQDPRGSERKWWDGHPATA
ncbi:carboxylesterase/lipase family protein [Streptomyces sp. NPDC100445]|uniref:carboxylesterase/lipase family protein n=1 Tax=Streptomyces sp. NPDC100445 TaxID=3366102 RepID=UPI00382BFC3A